jgi:Ca2+-binding RTX toxin-like protein
MSSISFFYGEVSSYSSSHITISSGSSKGTYRGNFSFSSSGLVGGTVSGYEAYENDKLEAKFSGGNFSALTIYEYQLNGNAKGLLSYVLSGDDLINGSSGNDSLDAFNGNDKLYGNDGNDILSAGNCDDLFNGGAGSDTADYQQASAGVTLNLSNAQPQYNEGEGFDTLTGIENLIGSRYKDSLTGNAVANTLNGGMGDDNLSSSAGNDLLIGEDGNDGLNGGAGNDTLLGGAGVDWGQFWSATAAVTIDLNLTTAQNTQGAGIDMLIGIENLNGTGFNDLLKGNNLDNILLGNKGNDTLVGGAGDDILTGGEGKDTFVLSAAPRSGTDRFNDFNPVQDTIQLENSFFPSLTRLGVISKENFKVGKEASDGNDFIIYNDKSGALLYDPDGNGHNTALKIAVLGTHPTLSLADIVVV